MAGLTQSDKIIKLLKERGPLGVTNFELNEIAYRYSARIAELRKDGYRIKTAHIAKATWIFVLLPNDSTDVSDCCQAPILYKSQCSLCGELCGRWAEEMGL